MYVVNIDIVTWHLSLLIFLCNTVTLILLFKIFVTWENWCNFEKSPDCWLTVEWKTVNVPSSSIIVPIGTTDEIQTIKKKNSFVFLNTKGQAKLSLRTQNCSATLNLNCYKYKYNLDMCILNTFTNIIQVLFLSWLSPCEVCSLSKLNKANVKPW